MFVVGGLAAILIIGFCEYRDLFFALPVVWISLIALILIAWNPYRASDEYKEEVDDKKVNETNTDKEEIDNVNKLLAIAWDDKTNTNGEYSKKTS